MDNISKILGYKKEVKILKSVCDLLKNTRKYLHFGATIPKGLLLYGFCGVGKTFMAKALVADCGRIPFFINGRGLKEIVRVFKKAKKAGNSVIFIDDIDSALSDEYGEAFSLLSDEMDCIENGEVFVIATAEKTENLPDYLLSEERFGIKSELFPPELKDSREIFKIAFKDKIIEENFNFEDFCCFADGWTYPMVERALNFAALAAVYDGAEKIAMRHVVEAALKLIDTPLAEKYDRETALHEAGHAAVQMLVGGEAGCILLTEGGGGHFTDKNPKEDTYADRERKYIVGVAGKACAEVFYDTCALGTYTDLQSVANGLEADLSKLATLGFDFYDSTKKLDSPEFNNRLANGIQSRMRIYYEKAKSLIEENKSLVIAIADGLKEKHFLLSSELHKIFADYLKERH